MITVLIRQAKEYKLIVILLVAIFAFNASCEIDSKKTTTKLSRSIIVADSIAYINSDLADSLYREVLKESGANSLEKGRAKLGLAKLLNSKGKKDSVMVLYDEVAELINQSNDTILMLGYLLDKGNFFMQEYENDSVEKYFKDGLLIATRANDEKYIQGFTISHGQFYIDNGDYKLATKILLEGLKSAEYSHNLPHQAVALQNLAIAASRTNDFGEAIELQRRSLAIKKELNLMGDYAEGLQNMGIYHRNLQEYDSALACYDEAHEVMSSLGDSMGILKLTYNRGLVLKNMGKTKEAEEIFIQVLAKSKKMNETMGEMFALSALSGIYIQKSDYVKALETNELAISIAKVKDFAKWAGFFLLKL